MVHSQGIRADGLIKHIDIPTVITLRNYPYYDYLSKFGWIKGRLMVFNHMKTINSNYLNCIACAESISKEFEQNNLQLDFIQNGVDVEKFKPLSHDEKTSLRMKFNIHKEKVFITVGSLIPRKDVATVIKGFKAYNKNNDSLLLIAGDGFEESYLKSLSDNDDDIVFLGNVSNVVEYLQLSDCFISASLAEGLPNTVLEAMSCGLPTVLSNIPSHQELYRDKQGIFFNKKDSNKLSELLSNISNDFDIQKKISLSLVSNNFSAKMMSEKYQEKYQEKLNGSI